MPAGNWIAYGEGVMHLLDSGNFNSDAFRAVLVDGYVHDTEHTAYSQISASEVANGNGYTTHGLAVTPTLSRSGQVITMDISDLAWSAVGTLAAEGVVLVKDANSDGALAGTDVPIAYLDLDTGDDGPDGADLTATDGDLTVTINAAGILTITLASS